MKSFNRRAVTRAGRTLNGMSEFLKRNSYKQANEIEESVRLLNAVAYQYYLIPKETREMYFREELIPDGVQLCTVSEE